MFQIIVGFSYRLNNETWIMYCSFTLALVYDDAACMSNVWNAISFWMDLPINDDKFYCFLTASYHSGETRPWPASNNIICDVCKPHMVPKFSPGSKTPVTVNEVWRRLKIFTRFSCHISCQICGFSYRLDSFSEVTAKETGIVYCRLMLASLYHDPVLLSNV